MSKQQKAKRKRGRPAKSAAEKPVPHSFRFPRDLEKKVQEQIGRIEAPLSTAVHGCLSDFIAAWVEKEIQRKREKMDARPKPEGSQ